MPRFARLSTRGSSSASPQRDDSNSHRSAQNSANRGDRSPSIFEQGFRDLLDAATPLHTLDGQDACPAPAPAPIEPPGTSSGTTKRRTNAVGGGAKSTATERFGRLAVKAKLYKRAQNQFETSMVKSRFGQGMAERVATRKKWERQKEARLDTFMMGLTHGKVRRLRIYGPIFCMIGLLSIFGSIQLREGGLLGGTTAWESMPALRQLASSLEADWSRLPGVLAYLFPMMVVLLVCHITALRSMTKLNEVESLIFDYSGHTVVCGACHQSLKFAALMKRRGYLVVVITRRSAMVAHSELDLTGVRFLPVDNYSNASMLTRAGITRAALFYAATGDDAENLCLAYVVSGLLAACVRGKRAKLQGWINMSEVRSANIGSMLARAGNANFTVDLIEYQQAAARLCIEAHPPWGNRSGPPMAANVEPPIHVVVIGLEAIGRNLVHQLIKVGHFADEAKLHITIISANQTEIAAYRMLHAQYPHLETIVEIQNIEEQPEFITDDRWKEVQNSFGPVQAIYIADVADELRVVQIALGLRMLPSSEPRPIIVGCIDTPNHAAHQALFEAFRDDFKIFSVHDKVRIEELVDQRLDALAKVVHETYRQDYGGKTWEELSFGERANNRYAADHFSVRKGILVHAAGYPDILDNVPKIEAMLENRSGVYGHLLESLAKVEHRRWVATKMLDGWKTGYGEKNNQRREHPSLVPYDLLSDTEKEKCRKSVLGLPKQLMAAQEVAASNSIWYSSSPPITGFGWMFMALHLFTYAMFSTLAALIVLFAVELFSGNGVNPAPAT